MSDALANAVLQHGAGLIPPRQSQWERFAHGLVFSAGESRQYPTLLRAGSSVAKDVKINAKDVTGKGAEEAVSQADKMCWASRLDFQAVLTLLRTGDLKVRDAEVQKVFEALRRCTEDGIFLSELYDILHPIGGSFEYMSFQTGNKLRQALDQARACQRGIRDQDVIDVLKEELDATVLEKFGFLRTPWSWGKFPGPGDYVGDVRVLSHHPYTPAALFGTGAGHDLPRKLTPGPGDYQIPAPGLVSPRTPSVSAGTVPARIHVVANINVPGPAEYDASAAASSRYKSVPSITIGRELRHGAQLSLGQAALGSSRNQLKLHTTEHRFLKPVPQDNRKSFDNRNQVEFKAARNRDILVGSSPLRWDISPVGSPSEGLASI